MLRGSHAWRTCERCVTNGTECFGGVTLPIAVPFKSKPFVSRHASTRTHWLDRMQGVLAKMLKTRLDVVFHRLVIYSESIFGLWEKCRRFDDLWRWWMLLQSLMKHKIGPSSEKSKLKFVREPVFRFVDQIIATYDRLKKKPSLWLDFINWKLTESTKVWSPQSNTTQKQTNKSCCRAGTRHSSRPRGLVHP